MSLCPNPTPMLSATTIVRIRRALPCLARRAGHDYPDARYDYPDARYRQLTKRFGPLSPDTAQRLQTATTEQLELWADRILEAPTLAAVFD